MTASGGSRHSTSRVPGVPPSATSRSCPSAVGCPPTPAAATVGFDHADEAAGPGWYRVRLADGVSVSLAAGDRTGLATFRFPTGPQGRLLLKADGSLAGTRTQPTELPEPERGRRQCDERRILRLPGQLSRPCPAALRPTRGGARHLGGGSAPRRLRRGRGGRRLGRLRHPETLRGPGAGRGVLRGSRRCAREPRGRDRPAGRSPGCGTRPRLVWARELGRVSTTGGTPVEQVLFRSALYRVLLNPMTVSDSDGRYPGFDGLVHRLPPGRRQYSALPGWDAYRTHMPLLAWLRPDVASEVVRSLQRAGQQGGLAAALAVRGVVHRDHERRLGGADGGLRARVRRPRLLPGRPWSRSSSGRPTQTDGPPGQGWFQPRPGLADYLRLGFVPNTVPERGWPQPHGASTTIEYAVDDFAVSRLAEAAGRTSDADRAAPAQRLVAQPPRPSPAACCCRGTPTARSRRPGSTRTPVVTASRRATRRSTPGASPRT